MLVVHNQMSRESRGIIELVYSNRPARGLVQDLYVICNLVQSRCLSEFKRIILVGWLERRLDST